jgi:signal transduction histidine kinase/CheY-like chemotaxis protein
MLGRFKKLEEEEALRNVERARDALDDQILNLETTASDWAHWDDAAAFVQGRMSGFISSNLMDDTFLTLKLNVIVFIGPVGRTVYERWFDRDAQAIMSSLAGFAHAIAPGSPLVGQADIEYHREGLLVLPDAILMVASQAITNSLRNPPALGVLVFGRIIGAAEMESLSHIVHLPVSLLRKGDSALLAQGTGSAATVRAIDGNTISSSLWVPEVTGGTGLLLRVNSERPIFQQGRLSIGILAASLIVCCLLSAALVFVLLSTKVLAPLSALAESVRRVGASGGATRIAVHGRDEIAEVSRAINGTLDALSHSEEERIRLEERLAQVHKLEAIGTLAGGVAHDFNNILMAIVGFCDLLRDILGPGAEGGAEVEEIRKAGKRATTLTAQLLAFSRKQQLEPRVLDLNALLSDMAGMLRRLLGEHLVLELTLEPGLRPIRADRGQLEQVILNLVVNARDAMPGGGTLTIATRNVSIGADPPTDRLGLNPGEYICCRVADTGVGMEQEIQARLFEPFFTTKDLGKGTGLGLSVVWGIVRQTGGTISVASAPGQGSTFEIYLPASAEEIPEPTSQLITPSSGPRKGVVLVAEDDAVIRNLLVVALNKAGFETLEASDGIEALRRVEERGGNEIQLLLTDIVMPRMGGVTLAARLRKKYPSMKVLFISGNADLMGAEAKPPDDVFLLQKPFDTDRLVYTVRAALGG